MADLTMTADKFTYSFKCIFDNEITIVDDEWQFTSNLKFWFWQRFMQFWQWMEVFCHSFWQWLHDNKWQFTSIEVQFYDDLYTI